MKKNLSILFTVFLILAAVFEAVLLNFNLKAKQALENRFLKVSGENQRFKNEFNRAQQLADSLKESLEIKKDEVFKEQVKINNLQEQLIEAKGIINGLSNELNLADKLKAEKEKELELAQKKYKDFRKSRQLPFRKRIKELARVLSKSNKEIGELKKKLNTSEKTCSLLTENNKYLAQGSKELELVRMRLFDELHQTREQLVKQSEKINEQNRSLGELSASAQESKKHIEQLSDILTRRELELFSREKEVQELKGRLLDLDSEKTDLEAQLGTVSDEQKKTQSLLNDLAQLKDTFEEKLTQFSQPQDDIGEKEKTEELRRKVEVILDSANP